MIRFTFVPNLENRAPFGVSVITHTIRHTVGLLWTSDQPVAETSTYTAQHNIQTQQTNIHAPSGIEPAIPATKRPQTYALDQWYSTFFVRVIPDIISLQLCTPKVVGT
jgi:hypothetical protein